MMIPIRYVMLIGISVCVCACLDQTSIQTDYVSERSSCQGEAESRIDEYSGEIASDDVRAKNAKLVSLFSDCMFARGWSVATAQPAAKPTDNPLEAARKSQAQADQPAQSPLAPVYQQQQQPQPAPVYAPAPTQQPAPVYYQQVPAPAQQQPLIYPQQKVAPNVQQQAPVYYQQVPAPQGYVPPQQTPVYYQQVPAPTYAPQPSPVYYQPAPISQSGYAPQPTSQEPPHSAIEVKPSESSGPE